MCLMIVAAIGNAIATGTTNIGARFFAMFLMPMGAVSACKSNDLVLRGDVPRPKCDTRSDKRWCVDRPDHSILGGQLVPATTCKAVHLDRHCKHDRQYSQHLWLVYVPGLGIPAVHTGRNSKYYHLPHGRASGTHAALRACEREQGARAIGGAGACRWRPGREWGEWGQEDDWLQICLLSG